MVSGARRAKGARVAKMSRYAANWNAGGHADSLRDIAVYAAMLESLDAEE